MKKLFFAALAATAIFASCSKNEPVTNNSAMTGDSPQAVITLTTEDASSRAFFDNTATAEAWEKEVNSLNVYVFDQSGNFILRRDFTSGELTAKTATLPLPNSAAGTQCDFYVVANANYGTIASKAAMTNAIESATLADYNGTTAVVMAQAARTGGFVMNGSKSVTVAAQGSTTNVAVTIKRVVAKVAVRTTIDPIVATKYGGGTVFITSAELTKASALSYSFATPGQYQSRSSLYTYEQPGKTTGANKDNLFYCYETDELTAGARTTITLKGVFDADANAGTTHDQIAVSYNVELDGAGNGKIVRNGYYRVNANITGLSGDGVIVNFTVAEWETPATQTINLGS